MDARSLLTSQGWRGPGHSLHPTSDEHGLSRPILASQKHNFLGIGKKQHRTNDMWWMEAFDRSLKNLDATEEGKVVQTIRTGDLDMTVERRPKIAENGGLYTSFVKGEGLLGTISSGNHDLPSFVEKSRLDRTTRKMKKENRSRKVCQRTTGVLGRGSLAPEAAAEVDDGRHVNKQNWEPQKQMKLPCESGKGENEVTVISQRRKRKRKQKQKSKRRP